MIIFFTSINNAYIDKAEVMARSLRAFHPECEVHCALADRVDPDVSYDFFDEVHAIHDPEIPVPDLQSWVAKHSVVELCTAIKPFTFKKLLSRKNVDAVVYLDPDTLVFSRFDEVFTELSRASIILTPHVTVPGVLEDDILDGELMGCLHHGAFNLGFLGLKLAGDGSKFLAWWSTRCKEYCFDDKDRFLFTDQKWVDLAPAMFDDIFILRHPGYNMATWNLYYRKLSKNKNQQFLINGEYPLRFFHFSGFDKGAHDMMLERHAPESVEMKALTASYREALRAVTQK